MYNAQFFCYCFKLRTNIKINTNFQHRYLHALAKFATAERIELSSSIHTAQKWIRCRFFFTEITQTPNIRLLYCTLFCTSAGLTQCHGYYDCIWKQKTERHKLKLASGYDVSKNGCEWNSNPCPHQPETYSGIEVAVIVKCRKALNTQPPQLCVDSGTLTLFEF